jgi:DNA-binding response OmpR family regulator
MRVFLIEDHHTVARSIELVLKSESFNAYTADLGEEGVDLAWAWTSSSTGDLGGLGCDPALADRDIPTARGGPV